MNYGEHTIDLPWGSAVGLPALAVGFMICLVGVAIIVRAFRPILQDYWAYKSGRVLEAASGLPDTAEQQRVMRVAQLLSKIASLVIPAPKANGQVEKAPAIAGDDGSPTVTH